MKDFETAPLDDQKSWRRSLKGEEGVWGVWEGKEDGEMIGCWSFKDKRKGHVLQKFQ